MKMTPEETEEYLQRPEVQKIIQLANEYFKNNPPKLDEQQQRIWDESKKELLEHIKNIEAQRNERTR
jgi:hypothetical protein